MNRVIKFRGKRLDNGQWVYGGVVFGKSTKVYIFQGEDVGVLDDDCCVVIPETVGQFTGLTDKNGVDIYEGDLVKLGKTDVVIKYNQQACQFWMEWTVFKQHRFEVLSATFSDGVVFQNDYIEVIGNIHDNG